MSDFWGYRGKVPPFKRYGHIGPISVERVPSWNDPSYSRLGAWRHDHGFTLRYRAYLLIVSR